MATKWEMLSFVSRIQRSIDILHQLTNDIKVRFRFGFSLHADVSYILEAKEIGDISVQAGWILEGGLVGQKVMAGFSLF